MKKYKMYIDLCKKNMKLIFVGVFLLTVEAVMAIKMPFMLNNVLDELFIISDENYRSFITGFLMYSVLFVIQMFAGLVSTLLFKRLGVKNSAVITNDLMKKVFFSVRGTSPQFNVGNVMQIMSGDAFNIGENGILTVYRIIQTIINITAIFYYMWTSFPLMAILISVEFIAVMIIQTSILKRIHKIMVHNREFRGKYSYLVNNFINDYFNYRRIHCFEYFSKKFKRDTDELLENSYSLEKTLVLNGLMGGLVMIMNFILIFGIGSLQVCNGVITISTLITFNMYSNNFGNNISSIPNIVKNLKDFTVSYERVMKMYGICCYDDNKDCGLVPSDIKNITFSDIAFTYNEMIPPVINDFCVNLEKGNIYCIKGNNGSGKSTLLSIISGEYPLSAGVSKINGNSVDLYTGNFDLNEHISFQSSGNTLFNDTIRNNILLENKDDNEFTRKINDLYSIFNISDNAEMQLDKEINDMKNNLSDGQKQKIVLIRTLVDNREVMIFDEPEKHLDADSKKNFMNYLNSIKNTKNIILVSHEEGIQNMCDYIISMDAIEKMEELYEKA